VDLHTEWLTIDGAAGSLAAYLARPTAASEPMPGLVVLQEVWGVDDHIEALTQRLARAAAARDAWARTLAFFAAALDPVAVAPVPA
jgi:carboxymethylenebutenolidase